MKIDILPKNIIDLVKAEATGLDFGMIRLEIFLRDGRPRYVIVKEKSIIPADDRPGVTIGQVRI